MVLRLFWAAAADDGEHGTGGGDGGAGQGLRVDAAADDRGPICAMRTSMRQPLPDMFRKIFAQWEQLFCP